MLKLSILLLWLILRLMVRCGRILISLGRLIRIAVSRLRHLLLRLGLRLRHDLEQVIRRTCLIILVLLQSLLDLAITKSKPQLLNVLHHCIYLTLAYGTHF